MKQDAVRTPLNPQKASVGLGWVGWVVLHTLSFPGHILDVAFHFVSFRFVSFHFISFDISQVLMMKFCSYAIGMPDLLRAGTLTLWRRAGGAHFKGVLQNTKKGCQ